FALAYKQTGLGRRLALWLVRALGSNTITLAYAVALADIALAPFTPSNTARAAGTMYPIVSQIPPLYKSEPNSPTAGRIGSYILWVT
ncbi:anion permease, partial [Streptomyces galilaeus]|uniref:anion permease n=1 Tax=Streptomyces galilaeus TaxID=33899 RepID=UPI0038F71000